mgnify:FL=1
MDVVPTPSHLTLAHSKKIIALSAQILETTTSTEAILEIVNKVENIQSRIDLYKHLSHNHPDTKAGHVFSVCQHRLNFSRYPDNHDVAGEYLYATQLAYLKGALPQAAVQNAIKEAIPFGTSIGREIAGYSALAQATAPKSEDCFWYSLLASKAKVRAKLNEKNANECLDYAIGYADFSKTPDKEILHAVELIAAQDSSGKILRSILPRAIEACAPASPERQSLEDRQLKLMGLRRISFGQGQLPTPEQLEALQKSIDSINTPTPIEFPQA